MYIRIKTYIIIILIAVFSAASMYAAELNATDTKAIINRVSNESGKINTFEANFEEVKNIQILKEKSIATGKIYYAKKGKLRWEYRKPTVLFFVVNEGKTSVIKNGVLERENSPSTMVFQQIGKIILSSISGEKLVDEKNFNTQCFQEDGVYRLVLTPQKLQMRNMVQSIQMLFTCNELSITEIRICNKDSITKIHFTNSKINHQLPLDLFTNLAINQRTK